MSKKGFALVIAVTTFFVGVLLAKISLRPAKQIPTTTRAPLLSNYELSGPYTHKNLTIFLIHGSDESNKLYLPLQEALERKQLVVYETREVNELAIENLSKTDDVLVQAGDIVKGGRQDRVLAVDLIVPAHSGKISIDAFCVENGRWQQRGAEQAETFALSTDMVSTKGLKLATKGEPQQSKVWQEVARAQSDLRRSLRTEVAGIASPSSMQLSLENQAVQETAADYLQTLSSIVDGKRDVIGYVFAINQQLNSADIYPSTALFKRFWPKLLRASAIEAVGAGSNDETSNTGESSLNGRKDIVSFEAVKNLFVDAEKGAESTTNVTDRTRMIKRESDKNLFFETRDMLYGGFWIHRSYLTK